MGGKRLELDLTKLKELYLSGKTLDEVGFELGCCRKTVENRLKEMGIKTRGRAGGIELRWTKRRGHPLDYEKIIGLYEQGHSMTGVAKILGCNVSTVTNYLDNS